MKVIKSLLLCSAVFFSLLGCEENNTYKARLKDPQLFHNSMQALSDVIVYDIFSPPVASRVYMYPTIAAYAVMQKQYPKKYEDMAGQLSDFKTIPEINDPDIHAELAAIHAFLKVGTALIFSEDKIIEYRDSLYASLEQDGLPSSVKEASLAYGDLVAAHILAWADTDFYKQTRTFPKYTIQEGTAFWKPTPPDYMEGIEPHWNKIRTLVLDTADQFEPAPPYPVDMSKDSPFYKELMEVYELGEKIDGSTEATEIASFWDCNPYVSHHRGHAMFATKKITPGGHWIGI
ncbi:MAG: phosphatidic acid phosphatase, partial [Flavobacteriaceae bacterium]|nr:phosphatidic acid phosphatase [Flavobacteriaceae bacterium]